ncbi:porin [Vibrio sp. FNV 38]|nr:porin [Vibrio sp. FNV 38]
MKTSAVASALLLALASTSTVAATVYSNDGTELSIGGRAEFRGDFTDEIEGSMEDNSRARLNVKGSSEISSGLTAFAFYEAEHKTGDSNFSNRYLYAGLDTEVGAFSAGRQDMAAVIVSDMTDITEFSGLQQYTAAASDKTNSVFAYRGAFDAVQVEATYSANEDKDGDLFSVAGMYSAPFGLDVALSYSADDADTTQFLGGLGYSIENLYVAGTFSVGDVDNDTEFTAYEISAAYKLTSEFSIALNYGFAEEDTKGSGKEDTVDQFEIAGYYKFNSNFRTYVSYLAEQLKGEDDIVRLGVRYDF